jgi:hypothetical protein
MLDQPEFNIDLQIHGRPTWTKVLVRLVVLYVVMMYLCWREVRYANRGIELPAVVEVVQLKPRGGARVRYSFIDPGDHRVRHNTQMVGGNAPPAGSRVTIQVIHGDTTSSRLKSSANPVLIWVFYSVTALLLLSVTALLVYWSREAHRRPLTRQQRAVLAARAQRKSDLTVAISRR